MQWDKRMVSIFPNPSRLDDIGKVVQDLSQNVRNLEQLHLRLSEKDRVKLEDQIRSLRTDVDREASEFQLLRERAMVSSFDQHTTLPDDASASNPTAELDTGESELRQRQVATSRLNDSYDLLEQDLIMLRETIGEVAQLVAQQNQQISHTDHLIHTAQDRIRNASTLLQKAVHSRYLTLASGALLGATLGGPIGCVMGMKIGALVALSGSAVGALSANLWQNRAARTDQSHDESSAYNQAML